MGVLRWFSRSPPPPVPLRPDLGLALQGGGIFGAWAWGVLDRLLEEPRFRPIMVSGASAGALNAVVMAAGLAEGGQERARQRLRELWTGVADMPFLKLLGTPGAHLQLDLLTRLLSPYQFNPLNINPLRDLLMRLVDFERLRRDPPLGLFLSATHVPSGTARIFREHEVTAEVVLASTCLPSLHHTVEIDGESYWDGGFSANPPLLPLALDSTCRALLLVKLTPDAEPRVPVTAQAIAARMQRLLFNTPLLRDLEALERMRGHLKPFRWLPHDLARLKGLEPAWPSTAPWWIAVTAKPRLGK
ncbi:hypothetical protein A6A04_00050 [Paramagnetospirillum marisnigri]|uniref:PNPLA domain-containing protein n=1 Tax=Paramagnetospirillum marisnigri TaxID=1285242 RepID=A0A178MRC6_9PROT|nr:patatin-like phospholipase family protein [Paramagnetospirillum marisnigri]OAN52141.1 hypothetical protein A6A04_00050 [Paramagnetospirillum marisnigri]